MCQSSYSHYLLITILWLYHLISMWLPPDHTSLQFKLPIAQCDPAAWLPHYEPIIILPLLSHNCTATLSPCFNAALKSLHKSLCHPTTFWYLKPCSCHSGVTTSIHSIWYSRRAHPGKWQASYDVNACEICSSGKMACNAWCKCLWNWIATILWIC